jgi:hypothetical protein
MFLVAGGTNLILNTLFLYIFTDLFEFWYILSQVFSTALLTILNFFLYRHVIFQEEAIFKNRTLLILGVLVGVLLWGLLHVPGVMFGTYNLPLHGGYIGDEQSPVNGALHILEDRSIFGLQDSTAFRYGPFFGILMVPAALLDAATQFGSGVVHSVEEYKHFILYDWGGIDVWGRIITVFFSFITLYAVFRLFRDSRESFLVSLLGVLLVATNFYFFEYSHFIKHWPFLITGLVIGLWSLFRIVEEGGKRWWVLHTLATLFGIGIGYISVVFFVMWIPVLILWFRSNMYPKLLSFVRMCAWIVAGTLALIVWAPYPFFRLLGFFGVGEDIAKLGDTQNPLAFSVGSLSYYGSLVVVNHLALFIAAIILLFLLSRIRIFSSWKFWAILLPGLANLALFLPAEHHEGRYMLPTLIPFLLLTTFLFGEYMRSHARTTFFTGVFLFLFAWTVLFHVVHIGGWVAAYAQGPSEERMVEDLHEGAYKHVLFVGGYIVATPHTKDAYERYVVHSEKETVNLYKELLRAPSPQTPLLNATYIYLDDLYEDPSTIRSYDQIVYRYRPFPDALNDFDYIDEDITRIWWFPHFTPSYIFLK